MRKRFPTTIVRVLLALALVAGLVAITAAPAGAVVTSVGFTATPTTAGAATQYIVAFTASGTGALVAGVNTITITFPAQLTVPATIAKEYVSVTSGGSTNVTAVDPVVIGNTVTLITPTAVANSAAATVTFAQVAGIQNPPLAAAANYYLGYVNTNGTGDTTPVVSATYSAITTAVTFSPASTIRGAAVTVTGVGFTPALSVDITSGAIGSGTVAAGGTFSVVATAATAATIVATDGAGGTGTSATALVLLPSVVLNPISGLAGTTTTVIGYDFTVGQTINVNSITFANVAGVHAASGTLVDLDGDGALDDFTLTCVVPPALTPGDKQVVVADTASGVGRTTFTVVARPLSLTPTSGPRGTQVTTTGTNMTPDTASIVSQIAIGYLDFGGANWNTAAAIAIDSNGVISPTTLVVPSTAIIGSNLVQAEDDGVDDTSNNTDDLFASAIFTVTRPTITVSPASGPEGTVISISGTGWVPLTRGNVVVTLAGATVTATPAADGSFGAALTVPTAAAVGANTVSAADSLGNTITATFTVPVPTVVLNPTVGPSGTVVTVTGTAFTAQWPVAITVVGSTIPTTPTMVVTDTLGGFTATFTMPGLAGVQPVIATAGATSATTFFTITAAPATVASAVASISDELVRVWGYTTADGWQMYDPADVVGSDLASLTAGRGYWIKVDADVTLIFGGNSWDLSTGWNLMGW